MLDRLQVEGWDRIDGDENHLTLIREDRLAKVTIKRVTFADHGEAWMAKRWEKDTPHGRSEFDADVADHERETFIEKVRALCER